MNKKQYFMFLWGLCSIAPILHALFTIKIVQEKPEYILVMFGYLWTIIVSGIFLTFGLDFGERIGIRFFLWKDQNFDWKKDLLMPTMIVSIVYALYYLFAGGIAIYGNPTLFLPLQAKLTISSLPYLFYISNAMVGLLFYLSVIVVLLRKISKTASFSYLIPIAIAIIVILMIFFQPKTTIMHSIESICISLIMLVLLWKKGFETLLLTGFIVAFISYLAEPILLLLKNKL